MNQRNDNLITVLDAGSTKSCVLVAELVDGVLRYRGHGIEASRGMRRGVISDLGPAAEAINLAALTAEKATKAPIETAVVGIGGPHLRGVNSQGGISMGSRMKEITREDVRSAIDRARSIGLAPDREVLHLLPQQFILDDQAGIHDPVGMVGNRLEVCLHLATCSGSMAQSVVTCANKAGLEVVDTVFEGLASAEAVLSADERELGVCVADIGASSTELVVFFEGSVAHTAVLPIGGDHFTNDLAVGLHVSVEEAELKSAAILPPAARLPGRFARDFLPKSSSHAPASCSPCCATTCAPAVCLKPWARAASSLAAELTWSACWITRKACCVCRPASAIPSRSAACPPNSPGRSSLRPSVCCSTPTARRSARPAKNRGCGRS
jgi:hypothetical protein